MPTDRGIYVFRRIKKLHRTNTSITTGNKINKRVIWWVGIGSRPMLRQGVCELRLSIKKFSSRKDKEASPDITKLHRTNTFPLSWATKKESFLSILILLYVVYFIMTLL